MLKRALASIVSVVLLAEIIPASAMAQPQPQTPSQENDATAPAASVLSVVGEDQSRRQANVKHFRMSDGSYVAAVYSGNVHYEDENGNWQYIDNTLEKKTKNNGDSYYTNKANSMTVELPEKTGSQQPVQITCGGYTLNWTLAGQGASTAVAVQPAELDSANPAAQTALISQQTGSTQEQAGLENHEAMVPDRQTSQVRYNDLLDQTDVYYDVQGDKLKESLILDSLPQQAVYRFHIQAEGLTATLKPDNSVAFCEGDSALPVFWIATPFMFDAQGRKSDDIEVSLQQEGNGYAYTLRPDTEWLASAVYPVTIDPTVQTTKTNLSTAQVYEKEPSKVFGNSTAWSMYAGTDYVDNQNYEYRAYVQIPMPALETTDYITQATLTMQYMPTSTASLYNTQINVHEVTASWSPSSIRWSNQPTFNSQALDYTNSNRTLYAYDQFDITPLVEKWAQGGANYGVVLKGGVTTNTRADYASYYTENSSVSDNRPYITIAYRRMNGIDSQWAYTTLGSDRDTSAMVNHNAGNLVVTTAAGSTEGEHFPVNLQLIYSYPDSTGQVYGKCSMGSHWRSNYNLEVHPGTADYPYYMIDSSGRQVYFYTTGGKLVDELGLGYTLTVDASSTLARYVVSDGSITMYFDSNGYLQKTEDADGYTNTFTYSGPSPYDNNYALSSITDGSGKTLTINYWSDYRIKNIVEPDGDTYTFSFTSSQIGSITDPNGKKTSFSYFNAYYTEPMDSITYPDTSKIVISYLNASQTSDFMTTRRFPVSSIRHEKSASVYEKYTYSYRHGETDVTDLQGNTVTYQFDQDGLTTGLVDQATGSGQYYEYGMPTDAGTGNELLKASKWMYSVNNKVKNPACSDSTNWASLATLGYTLSFDTAVGHTGNGSVKIQQAAGSSGTAWCGQAITGLEEGSYTASCYVTTNGNALANGTADLWLAATDSNGEVQRTAKAVGISQTAAGEWQRLVASISIQEGETLELKAGTQTQATGTFWLDDFQVEAGEAPNLYNLLQNTDFNYGDTGWSTPSAMGPGQATVPGIAGQAVRVSQTVPLACPEGEKISFGGWGKANSASLREYGRTNTPAFGIKLVFLTAGQLQTGDACYLSFNHSVTGWQFLCGEATVPAGAAYAKFSYEYNYNLNSASFKNGFVYRDVFNETDYTAVEEPEEEPFDYSQNKLWKVTQTDQYGNDIANEAFTATPATTLTGDTAYYILNAETEMALCAPSIDNDDLVYTHALYLNNSAYKWQLYDLGSSLYEFTALSAPAKNLTVKDSSTQSGGALHLSQHTGYMNQVFSLQYNNDGTFSILSPGMGRVDGTTAEDQPSDTRYSYVRQYATDTGNMGQRWIFIPVSSAGSQTIKTSATYSTDGQDMLTSTDERGKVTTYTYDHGNGNYHTQYITEPGRATIEYIYNSKDELTEVRSGSVYEINSYNSDGQITGMRYDHDATRYTFGYDDQGRPLSIDVGNGTLSNRLVSYTYNAQQLLAGRTYGNNGAHTYQYDRWGNVTHQNIGSHHFEYVYDKRGNLALQQDFANDVRTRYTYDESGNLTRYSTTAGASTDSGTEKMRVVLSYDNAGQVANTAVYIQGVQKGTYSYRQGSGAHAGQVQGAKFNGSERLTYTYDDFGRLTNIKINTSTPKNLSYTYLNGASTDKTTNLVAKETFGTGDELVYTYDNSGNITKIADASGNALRTYTYSSLTGRLLSEENAASGLKTTYHYGEYNGNILSKTITPLSGGTASTVTYTYGNTTGWKDQLTAYNGQAITYDAAGNPLTYRDGMTMTWQGGRELTGLSKGGVTTAYQYNENSIRTKKTVGASTTEYYLNGNTMIAEKKGSNLITYMFDENGERYGFLYNSTPYYYVRNIQGDVIRILNSAGSVVAKYEYDAWGKVLKVTNASGTVQTSSTFIGNVNPIRYRGYYYDSETGFYYLQSRYYDPETCRFINADDPEMIPATQKSLLSKDLFAYCENNSIRYYDPDGHLSLTAIYKYIEGSVHFYFPAARCIGWITKHANWLYNSTLKFSGYIYGQAKGNAAKARMGFRKGKDNGCGWIATYNALKILGKSIHPKHIIYFYECWGSILEGVFGVLPDAVADYFRVQGRKVSMLNLTNKGIDKKIKSSKVSILCYAHSKGMHYIAIRWTGKNFEAFNVYNDSTTSKKYKSIEQFLKDGYNKKSYKAISLIAIS